MIRVAVLENESELQRYGHANVLEKLKKAFKEKKEEYIFKSFTSANFENIFRSGTDYLMNYDSVFISTNALTDQETLNICRRNKELICQFIEKGKGIYIGYQKKLNIETKYYEQSNTTSDNQELNEIIKKNTIDFLPKEYCYYMPEAFSIEYDEQHKPYKYTSKESEAGEIHLESNQDSVILYPNKLYQQKIKLCCLNNSFKRHIYKSYIYPLYEGAYIPLITDYSTLENVSNFMLFARAKPKHNEKILVSTIAFDWEEHYDVLQNIIEYISKGVPNIVFIYSNEDKDIELDSLVRHTKLEKIASTSKKFTDLHQVDNTLHSIYIFSQYISTEEVEKKWKTLKLYRHRNIKFYHLKKNGILRDLVLTHYSNWGFLDSIIEKTLLYIVSDYAKYKNGLFGGGFWTTYDTLMAINSLDLKMQFDPRDTYKNNVLKAIKNRQKDDTKAYDNVIGCTLGMINLFVLYYFDNESIQNEMTDCIIPWLNKTIKNSSIYDKLTYWIFLQILMKNLSEERQEEKQYVESLTTNDLYKNIEVELASNVNKIELTNENELSLSRWIMFIECCGKDAKKDTILRKFIDALFNIRSIEGKWTNNSRTAFTLIYLLTTFDRDRIVELGLWDELQYSINYLLESYSEKYGAWSEEDCVELGEEFKPSLGATVKAVHAIWLYDKMNPFTAKDFVDLIKDESIAIDSSKIISQSFDTIEDLNKKIIDYGDENRKLRLKLNDKQKEYNELQKEHETLIKKADKDKIEYKWESRKRYERTAVLGIGFFVLFIVQLVVILKAMYSEEVDIRSEMYSVLITAITTVGSFGFTLILQKLIENKVFADKSQNPDELEENNDLDKEGKKGKKNVK